MSAAEHRAQEARAKFVPARLPERHRKFLEGLKISPTIGDYFFCHAGVRPGVPLDQQNRNDLLTVRDTFLLSQAEHGKLVVRGHTPSVSQRFAPIGSELTLPRMRPAA